MNYTEEQFQKLPKWAQEEILRLKNNNQPLLKKIRNINFADHLEKEVADILFELNINFIHESESKKPILDFYLIDFDVFIEVKQFSSDRIHKQLCDKDNVILIQGRKSVKMLKTLLMSFKNGNI